MSKPKIYLTVIDSNYIGIASVPEEGTLNDDWEKHSVEVVPNPWRRPKMRIEDAVTNLRNVRAEAGIDVVIE